MKEEDYLFCQGVSRVLLGAVFLIIPEYCCEGKTVCSASLYLSSFIHKVFNNRKWLLSRTWLVNAGFGQQGQNACEPEVLLPWFGTSGSRKARAFLWSPGFLWSQSFLWSKSFSVVYGLVNGTIKWEKLYLLISLTENRPAKSCDWL